MVDQAKLAKLSEIVAALNREPIARVMAGHRELFHSNMLAWFFDYFPDAADQVFGSMVQTGRAGARHARGVLREKGNIDLLMNWPDRGSLLIENKVFSIPSESQLIAYSTKTDDDTACWLLSLIDPGWTGGAKLLGRHIWRLKNYGDLGREIQASLASLSPSFEREMASRYAELVQRLSRLTVLLAPASDDEPIGLAPALKEVLSKNQLASGMVKVRAASVVKSVLAALPNYMPSRAGAGFSRGAEFVECFYPSTLSPDTEIGWQVQGGQFRLMVVSKLDKIYEKGGEPTPRGWEYAERYTDYLAFPPDLDEALGLTGEDADEPRRGARKDIYGYHPDVVYRFKLVPRLTVGQLKSAARQVVQRGFEAGLIAPVEAQRVSVDAPPELLDVTGGDIKTSDERPATIPGGEGKDRTKYRIDLGEPLSKRGAALSIVQTWLSRHQTVTRDDLFAAFPAHIHPHRELFVPLSDAQTRFPDRYFIAEEQILHLADGTAWSLTNQWAKDTIERLAARARELQIMVEAVVVVRSSRPAKSP